MNGADVFVGELKQRGVPYIATLCGHGLDPLFKACEDAGMRLITVRNEQAAGYIADITGRLSRQVGVCAVSSGVAHANALTGVLNACFDGAPMLLITGSGPTATMGRGHFQDLDQVALSAPICKYADVIRHAHLIPSYVHRAFSEALAGRPGPVHLTFPTDVQLAAAQPGTHHSGVVGTATAGEHQAIAAAADILAEAQQPFFIAGSGLYYARAEAALARFVDAFPIPVMTPIWDRGAVSAPMEAFMGVLGAATGGPKVLEEADVVLVAGARCDYRVGYLEPPFLRADARVIRIDADARELQQGAPADVAVLGDPGRVLDQIAREIAAKNIPVRKTWVTEARTRKEAFRKACIDASPRVAGQMYALDIVQAVQSVLTDETILLVDGGNIGQWMHQVLCNRYPGHWMTCGAGAVVGYGIPGAMAARALYPDRPVLLLSGDGSLTFTVAEFESAARQGLSFVTALADDQAWGITLTGHQARYGRGIGSELGPIDYAKMAEAFGASGVCINRAADIAPAIRKGFASPVPTLIHVPIGRSMPSAG